MNLQDEYNERFQKKLESKIFPAGQLSSVWWGYAHEALTFASVMSMAINPEDWDRIRCACLDRGPLTLYDFALLSNNLQRRTPRELSLSVCEYGELMAEADGYVKVWQELTNSMRADLDAEWAEETKARMLAANGPQGGLKVEA